MARQDENETEKDVPSGGIKSHEQIRFIDKQRQILGGLIADQLGPAAQLDEIISGNPPLPEEGMPEP